MSSQQAPLFIKIKHANSTRKVRVPNQPAPVWSKLSAAIVDRFGIPEGQPIGLQYLDPEGDIITISSQVEFDELKGLPRWPGFRGCPGPEPRLSGLGMGICQTPKPRGFLGVV
ncbi:hypothetical protein PGT21_011034 [Puccinia graminis f. sp. tritici]|uniref:PB1 domain-containing protein n=1 Tax=Puccinia graminis f. sp. tritici TaxID=56615 RepID=A0A5B0NS87_PUCGR|nr:hypothetical protein PGTUg99_015159 [Puccinia graminis f. sp. tritici]KAA1090698.1 hypothetical protein PGT21_011034 [Puccinia graminis f. sp. tritici]